MSSLLAACALVVSVGCGAPAATMPAPRPAPAPVASAAPAPPLPEAVVARDEPCTDVPAPVASATPSEDAPSTTDDGTVLDDGFEAPPMAGADGAGTATPIDALTDAELEKRLRTDMASLGTMSLGGIHSGALVNANQMPTGPHWELVSPTHAYGTRETIDALTRAIEKVNAQFPDTPKAFIGDISTQRGGFFPPHVSHQSGRDVDVSYYLSSGHRWYATANAQNLDLPRSWAFVRALITESDVELLLIDIRVQALLKAYALEIGEDKAWLDDVFQVGGKSARPLIFHVPGHASHIHARFWAPASRELGRRAYAYLVKQHIIRGPSAYVTYTAKPGETLGMIAQHFHTTSDAIRKANHMPTHRVVRGRAYRIPHATGVERQVAKLAIPARRLPPQKPVAVAQETPRAPTRPCARVTAAR